MKITLITQYYKPEMGAPQNRLLEMCVGLKNAGADISVITAMPNYPTGKIFETYKNKRVLTEYLDDIEVKRYWIYASNTRKILPRIWNMISFSCSVIGSLRYLKRRKNDFIIVESPPLTLGVSAWFLAKVTHARLLLNVSDLWPLSAKELGAVRENSLTWKFLAAIESFLYRHACVCMGQSREIVAYMEQHGAKTLYLFRNGVSPDRFTVIPVRQVNRSLRIVYTGLLGFAQGILDICKNINFSELNAEFHIYGAGGEQTEIETYLSEHPNKNIFFHGKVKREQIADVLCAADCTLIPLVKYIYGAVPSKIYESMAAGLPILFSGEGEGADIIRENNLGWISSSKDFDGLRKNIVLARDLTDWEQKQRNCRVCAQTLFNRPKQVQELYSYLKTL